MFTEMMQRLSKNIWNISEIRRERKDGISPEENTAERHEKTSKEDQR